MKKVELRDGFSLYIDEDLDKEKWTHLIISLPEIGLVGLLALRHISKQFEMKQRGFVISDDLAMFFKYENGIYVPNVRILSSEEEAVLLVEHPITPGNIIKVSKLLVDLINFLSPKLTIMLGSTPSMTREKKDLEKLNVFGAPSNEKLKKLLEENGVQLVKNGTLSGPYAYVLSYSVINGWDSFALLSETYPAPIGIDPESSAKLLKVLGNIIDKEIDISELKERAEEIKLEMRKLEQLAAPQPPKELGQLYT